MDPRSEALDGIRALLRVDRCGSNAAQQQHRQRHLRHGALRRIVQTEELSRTEPHHPGDDARGELLDRRVEVAHHGVVVAARILEVVLDIGQRLLEAGKARRCAQLRVCLGDREHTLQRAAERIFFARASRRGARAHLHGAATRGDQRLERAALVTGMAFDDGDDIGNKIVTALQLDVDVGPGVVAQLPQPNQSIEGEQRKQLVAEFDESRPAGLQARLDGFQHQPVVAHMRQDSGGHHGVELSIAELPSQGGRVLDVAPLDQLLRQPGRLEALAGGGDHGLGDVAARHLHAELRH